MKKIFFLLTFLFAAIPAYCQQESLQAIVSYLEESGKDENFSLSIAIAEGEQTRLQDAYGYASREHKVPNRVDTRHNIASIGKMFTAVAILQLYDQNRVDLYEKVGRYIPGFPNKAIRDSVSIHQLLTHTSGLPLWFSDDFDREPKYAYTDMKDYLPFFREMHIDSAKVGKNFYSNAGFYVLGFIIEAVSGMSYNDYVDKHIFQPLKMEHTGLWPTIAIIPGAATGYMRPASKYDYWKTNYHKNMSSGPAGGAYSTVSDLLTFFNALRNNQLLSPKTTALMLSPKVTGAYGQYGYGIGINKHNNHTLIGHEGAYYGIRGELMWYKDRDYTVAILANSDQVDYDDISHFIKTELTGSEAEKAIYKKTLKLLQDIKEGRFIVNEEHCRQIRQSGYDEDLVEIKAYYYLNNNDFKNALQLFTLNTLLFPESRGAKENLIKATKKQTG